MAVRKKLAIAWVMLATALGASSASASVVINGTRIIYPSTEREVTIKVTNDGALPALVQTWLDDGNPNVLPQDVKVPFTIVPPLFRLDSKKGQMLRMVYSQEPLPADKETVFWLNVLEVPPRDASSDKSMLQLAFRSRIKLFFRPAGLKGDAREAPSQVTWKFVQGKHGGAALEAINPTPYYVTFTKMTAMSGAGKWSNDKGGMVDPGGMAQFELDNAAPSASEPAEVDFTFLDDYGAAVAGKYTQVRKQ